MFLKSSTTKKHWSRANRRIWLCTDDENDACMRTGYGVTYSEWDIHTHITILIKMKSWLAFASLCMLTIAEQSQR